MSDNDTTPFEGFEEPKDNYCKVPHAIFGLLPAFSSKAELAIVLYVLRHTWGYQEYDEGKRITVDEFRFGRKRRDGTRIDSGIGMSKSAVLAGIEAATEHGFIKIEVDSSDKARVKKHYMLHMKQGYESHTPEVLKSDPRGKDSLPRTKKETKPVVPPPLVDDTPIPEDIYFFYQHILGQMVNSAREAEMLADIEKTYPLDWIKDAMEEAVRNNARKISYFDSILKRWQREGRKDTRPTNGKRPIASNPADNPNYYEEAAARENEEYIPKGQRQPASASPVPHTFANGLIALEVWHIALIDLNGQLDYDVYHATLGLSRFVDYEDGFVIQVSNQGIKDRLEKRLASKVESALRNAAGETVAVRYVVAG